MKKEFSISPELTEIVSSIEENKGNVSKEQVELYKNGVSKNIAENEFLKLLGVKRQKFVVSSDGEVARLSMTTKNKFFSGKAIQKSLNNGFSIKQHYAAIYDAKNLFENSIKVLTYPDKNKSRDIKAMHRFVAPLYGNNVAYMTVKESVEHGKLIYSIEVMELGKLEGNLEETKLNSVTTPASSPP